MSQIYNHIVICGYPRAGTSLLYSMMSTTVRFFQFYPKEIEALDAHLQNPLIPKVTKAPMDIKNVFEIQKIIPKVGFIICIRDPRDVLVSKMQGGYFKIAWDKAIHKSRNGNGVTTGLTTRHMYVRKVLEAKFPNVIICRYEDLVTNPFEMQRFIKTTFSLPIRGCFANFYKQNIPRAFRTRMRGLRPVSDEHIGNWKNYPERIYEQFKNGYQLREIVKELGYETDNTWLRGLTNEKDGE